MSQVVERVQVFDADSHVTEPPDLWTSRVPRKWGDLVPHVVWDERRGDERWLIGGKRVYGVGTTAMAGWREYPPGHPPTLDEADHASWDPKARLSRMDEYGVYAQVLYPNLIGFFMGAFLELKEHELMLACVQAYNDFVAEFASEDPARLIPIMAVPFWDVDLAVQEIDRAARLGHKGLLFAGRLDAVGLPALSDQHWDPIWRAAEERALPINFHIGFAVDAEEARVNRGTKKQTLRDWSRVEYAKTSAQGPMANLRTLCEVICSGIPHRFPDLKIVSVESGVGWLPFVIEALDWQWMNTGAFEEQPDMELPSFYFWRQIFGTWWFERGALAANIEQLQDNIMFSTDFPHPTSMSPGPASHALNPRDYVEETLAGVAEEIQLKVLRDNAKRVYNVT